MTLDDVVKGNVENAVVFYSAAIEKSVEANSDQALIVNCCNRSACYFQMEEFEHAKEDASLAWAKSNESNVKAILLVTDAMLRTNPPDLKKIRDRLDIAENLVNEQGPIYQEYRYYEFQYAIRSGQPAKAAEQANWLSENARGTRFETSALIQLAQAADQKLNASPNPDDLRRVIAVFERLVGLLGSSDDVLKKRTNARVAFLRLAELKLKAGEREKAIEMLESINRVFPNRKSYLRQLALAYVESSQFEKSTAIWRKLAAGLEPGTDLWFEAKYQLVSCLIKSDDRSSARQVYEQTVLLGDEMPQRWQTTFDSLSELLNDDE